MIFGIILSTTFLFLLIQYSEKIPDEKGNLYEIRKNEIIQVLILDIMFVAMAVLGREDGLISNPFVFFIIPLLCIQVFIDLKYMELADEWSWVLATLGICSLVYTNINKLFEIEGLNILLNVSLTVFVLFLSFFLLWLAVGGVGFGDVKLMIGIGWYLSFGVIFNYLYLSILIGSVFGAASIGLSYLFLRDRKKERGSNEFPFGPPLILSLMILTTINL